VEKVQDTATAAGATGGDGYLGNKATETATELSFEEVADQMWTRRLRNSTSGIE
jgi:uncharacterized protein YcfJ